jgi:hypothetical protein
MKSNYNLLQFDYNARFNYVINWNVISLANYFSGSASASHQDGN